MADHRWRDVAKECYRWKAKVMMLGYIYRRMTCKAQEAIIRLPATLVGTLLNMMPSLSHFEMWEPSVENKVTGNHYLEWKLKNLNCWRQPFHRFHPLSDGSCRWEERGQKGRGLSQKFSSKPLASPHRILEPILSPLLSVKVEIRCLRSLSADLKD